jgi:acetoin utilization deacetylase AcuC-like enzyme
MQTFYNSRHTEHHGKVEMFRGELVPCFEIPARADYVLQELRSRKLGVIEPPQAMEDAVITRVHAARYVDFLRGAWDEWVALDPANAQRDAFPSYWPIRTFRSDVLPASFAARMGLFSYDAGSPLTSGTWAAAREGAACAWSAAQHVMGGARGAFALTRPPGHHAGTDFFGGYCFLNNAAIAAQALRDAGCVRVAVLDIDYHHGNGTQAIFYDRADVLTVSVHGDPHTEYPYYLGYADERGTGAGGWVPTSTCRWRAAPALRPGAVHWPLPCSPLVNTGQMPWWWPWAWTRLKATPSRASACKAPIICKWAATLPPPGCPRCLPLKVATRWLKWA